MQMGLRLGLRGCLFRQPGFLLVIVVQPKHGLYLPESQIDAANFENGLYLVHARAVSASEAVQPRVAVQFHICV